MAWLAQLGGALLDDEQQAEGEKVLRRVIKAAPGEWRAWMFLGQALDAKARQAGLDGKPFKFSWSTETEIPRQFMDLHAKPEQLQQMHQLHQQARRCLDEAVRLAPRRAGPTSRAWSEWCFGALESAQAGQDQAGIAAAMFTTDFSENMAQVARIKENDPIAIALVLLLETKVRFTHGLVEQAAVKGDAHTAGRRDFSRWGLNQLAELTKKQDHNAAVAAELLAVSLVCLPDPELTKDVRRAFVKSAEDDNPLAAVLALLLPCGRD